MGTLYIFDELVFKGTIKDTAMEILNREKHFGIVSDNVIRILDPNKGKTPSNVTGLTLLNEFAINQLYCTADVNDSLSTGHLAVRERLHYDKKLPISTTNCPKLYFVKDKTRECMRQLFSYVWDDWRGRNQAGRSEKETPKDLNKDMPDCVRYLCVSNPYYMTEEPVQRFTGGGRTGWGV